MIHEYCQSNWDGILMFLYVCLSLIGCAGIIIHEACSIRRKRRQEEENQKREGEFRVIRTKNGEYWVQQFVYGVPNPHYYDDSGAAKWHWQYVTAYRDVQGALDHVARAEFLKKEAERKRANWERMAVARREEMQPVEVIDCKGAALKPEVGANAHKGA